MASSVGVSTGSSLVKSWSKLFTSRLVFCGDSKTHIGDTSESALCCHLVVVKQPCFSRCFTAGFGQASRVCSYDAGFKGRFHFSLLQQHPVDLPEEGVILDGLLAALAHHAAQTLGRVLGHELNAHTQACGINVFHLLLVQFPLPHLYSVLCPLMEQHGRFYYNTKTACSSFSPLLSASH